MSEVKKTLTATDKATKALLAASTALQGNVAQFTNQAAELAIDIEFKQSALDAINEGIAIAARKATAELALQVQENKDSVLSSLMGQAGLAAITADDLDILRSSLDTATNDTDRAVNKAVATVTAKLTADNNLAVKELAADQSVETATLKAEIQSLASRVSSLVETNDDLKGMLSAERDARVAVAEANRPVAATIVSK